MTPPGVVGTRRNSGWSTVGWGSRPLSSEHGIFKTVTAILWPWISGKSPQKVSHAPKSASNVSHARCSLFARHCEGLAHPAVQRSFSALSRSVWSHPFRETNPIPAPKSTNLQHRLRMSLFFFYISLEPRVERHRSLCALHMSPPRNCFTLLQSICP